MTLFLQPKNIVMATIEPYTLENPSRQSDQFLEEVGAWTQNSLNIQITRNSQKTSFNYANSTSSDN